MSDRDRIWREGDSLWVWPDGESVPRYMWSQVHQKDVVEQLNRIVELEKEEQLFNKTFDAQQAEIEQLRAENQRLRISLDMATKDNMKVKLMGVGDE